MPPLLLIAALEDRVLGPRDWRGRALAGLAGLFFTADLILWHRAIEDVGAGLATVLGNTQVVLVALVAWLLLRERPASNTLVAIPIVGVGVVLISGVVGAGAYGENPARGVVYGVLTGVAYTGFLLALRQAGGRRVAGPLSDATLVTALATLPAGLLLGDLDLTPPLAGMAWLIVLALTSQVFGWLLIAISLPRLPAALTSVLLTLQPVCSMLLAIAILSESPSALQLVGAATIVVGLVIVSRGRVGRDPAPVAEAG